MVNEVQYNTMILEILNNPVIIAGIIGAFASAIFGIITEGYKFRKQKRGAHALIKSEMFNSIKLLTDFKEKYLKDELIIDESENDFKITNFYNNMNNFPTLTNRNWVKLISFIPSMFKPDEINKINLFYTKCEGLSEDAIILSEKFNTRTSNSKYCEIHIYPNLEIINAHRNMFRNELEEVIQLGDQVKQIFN